MHRPILLILTLSWVALTGCREADRPLGPDDGGTVVVDSDPPGAQILLDGQATGKRTPDTLHQVNVGLRDIVVRLDSAGVRYGYGARVEARRGEVRDVRGSVMARCASESCFQTLVEYHAPNRARFSVSPTGSLFYVTGAGDGLYWPATTSNSYVASAAAVFAAELGATGQAVSLGVYASRDQFNNIFDYYAGRPVPELTHAAGAFELRQPVWVLPPGNLQFLPTVRGLSIDQQLVARSDVDDVVLIRLVYRNISADEHYRVMDPLVPASGLTYENAYLGFALDADVGDSNDDQLSYAPELDLAFMYDSRFRETSFAGGWADRPGLVGVRMLEAPPGTTVYMNGWWREADWTAGSDSEPNGLIWLSGGTPPGLGKHSTRIGYVPTEPRDYRVSVSAGPVRLAPGDSASITVAIVIAEPAAGEFTPGTEVAPGDPLNPNRPIMRIAAPLLERAVAAESLLGAP